ncbi:MAG TPA: hypothetical protein VI758_04595, partial [Bacteroidota bacterium]
MAKNGGSARGAGADHLIQVAGFLKQADKLVRERDYASALEQIAKARAKDPLNSYAEAYEQRVRILLSALNEKRLPTPRSNSFVSPTPESFSRHFENLSKLTILDPQRISGLGHEGELLDKRQFGPEHNLQRNDDNQRDADCSGSEPPLQRTFEFDSKGRAELAGEGESRELRKSGARPQSRSYVSSHPEESSDSVEGTKLPGEIVQCLQRAKQLLGERRLDEAISALGPAKALDPLNGEVLKLEHEIHDALWKDYEIRMHLHEEVQKRESLNREMHEKAVQAYVLKAAQLAGARQYSEALQCIAEGFAIDPSSPTLSSCKRYIHLLYNQEVRVTSPNPRLSVREGSSAADRA